jgi:protein-tyrosine-phosphatase
MNILLVCKFNRFRSKIAEAFFKKYTDHNVKSEGIIGGLPIDDEIFGCAERCGLKLDKTVRTLSWSTLNWQDIIIIVADNVPIEFFEDLRQVKKIYVWKIPDVGGQEGRVGVIKMIEEKVKRFKESSNI